MSKNRQLKFRVWDKKYKEFVHWTDASHDDGVMSGIFNLNTIPQFSHCILLQFTGLKDCQGKDIYEGDIVEWQFRGNWIIVYQGYRFCGKDATGFCVGFQDKILFDQTANHQLVKVIGNIYENPELIGHTNI
jgi:uncharacterized phage protein (TIGR01671 family)